MHKKIIDQLLTASDRSSIPIIIAKTIDINFLDDMQKNWLSTQNYSSVLKPNQYIILPNQKGFIDCVYVGENDQEFLFTLGDAYQKLPKGCYHIHGNYTGSQTEQLLLGYLLGAYQYNKFKPKNHKHIQFVVPEGCPVDSLKNSAYAHYLVKDLINDPANILTPEVFSKQIFSLFERISNITIHEWQGTSLLENNFPLIYAVGKASISPPRLIEIVYSNDCHYPNITLVGKGVCFDTGGLDIKSSANMRLMQKDMGGAAHIIALAYWIIQEKLPVNLRVLLPIVENAIDGNAMRPGDIVVSRSGLSVEIDNTDAEGRLILADALTYAIESPYDLLIDMATLTGAARVALGPEIPIFFTTNEKISEMIMNASKNHTDPMWPLPLYDGYREWIKSKNADLLNSAKLPYAGAITAGLFLQEFVPIIDKPYVHVDVMAWNIRSRPGRIEGGEAMGLRALYYAIKFFIDS